MTGVDLAAVVQAAADKLLRAVSAATPGDWQAAPVTYGQEIAPFWEIQAQALPNVIETVVSHQPHEGGGLDSQANAQYIVLAQPEVGRLLAEWLHVIASRMRDFQAAGVDPAQMADGRLMALVTKIKNLEI